ncbi:hypothetical protein [Desulforamulus aquiferis]|uniref:Uncharacterized protein n=1 Tax=Desulforamulus aquiferis TaxID=1397668 RepID=A0AAW7ZIJ8_9FIRM|nr:hypothetical protein [Desulforamulus aquiferis]MDO7789125.1 hypothetical protein [Desulforamulus aquiferis]
MIVECHVLICSNTKCKKNLAPHTDKALPNICSCRVAHYKGQAIDYCTKFSPKEVINESE